ncbi:VOC family protein [Longimicrobium terrae]|uniref:VOC domain-containing protein n=1 Tax=Longimicrobium terrae TaxID=1639882 RepID=A0A841GX04_9BACT|nr:VOC family protein [Longimicrobium terrae]MBB4634761.1 hypothetical protein [Longimicrobium terrae]MBB6069156.1 hypothetical protein [Longimicrobium terrae]NNC32028.1 VOC family protein [Longimicrobium terrae]
MPVINAYPAGSFCWLDMGANDLAVAERFYTALFGWTTDRTQFGPDEGDVYLRMKLHGRAAAAIYPLDPGQKMERVPSAWLSYLAVDDAEAAAARAVELGATLLAEPFDVMDEGRMVLLTDPSHATVALWEAKEHRGAEVRDEPGAATWTELATRDLAKAERFYTGLLGWTADTFTRGPVPYTLFLRDGEPVAGMLRLAQSMDGIPPHWMPFFAVTDVEGDLRRAEEMGAVRLVGPEPLAGVGRFATMQDPQGAAFSILQRTSR